MMQRKIVGALTAAIWARSILAVEEMHLGYTTNLCVSVIAIAGSPDYRYLQENGIDADIFDQGEEFVCELGTGLTVPIKGTQEQMRQMQSLLDDGTLISAEMTVGVADNFISTNGDDSVYLPSGEIILGPRKDGTRRRGARRTLEGGGGSDDRDRHRNLAGPYRRTYEGAKPILAVRVTDSGGNVHPDDASTISDKIFGTYGDAANARSQFAACSYGKLDVTNDYATDISRHLSAPGVIDIKIPISLVGNDRKTVRAKLIQAAQSKLGFELPGPFQHVMFVLERCYTDCGWAAYAYVNSWLSIYQGDNYKFLGVQMHELGHNLNMAHSGGLDGKTYTDHSCLMGNPFYKDDKGIMCYNPAKNFQIARGGNSWYNDNSYDTRVWNSGAVGGTRWSGTIVGIADYKNNPDYRPVVVKLETGTSNDLFVGFNRAEGINVEVADARNQVTVIEAGNNGVGYSQSFLKAVLSQGESYVVADWRGSGVDMTIRVEEVNLVADPGYAYVTMSFPTKSPTSNPTLGPTASPTKSPTSNPTVGPTPTEMPTASPTASPTKSPTSNPTLGPTASPTKGPTSNPTVGPTPTEMPTASPTKSPTSNPTLGPTASPTKGPTSNPTVGPTSMCGNSVCDIDENSSNCPIDCLEREIETTFEYNLGSGGNMFTVEAKRNIVILSFSINCSSRGVGGVKVYTRRGGYAGHVQDSRGWEVVYDNPAVVLAGRGKGTELGEFRRRVTVAGGESQSFFVTSTRGLVYKLGTQENSTFTSDESLSILEGIGTDATFSGKVISPRVWGGRIRYDVVEVDPPGACGDSVCAPNEGVESCPADCAGRELETTFEFDLGSSGSMFAVRALRDLSVSSLVINAMSRGRGAVRVFTRPGGYGGHERSGAGWKLVYDDPEVVHSRRGLPTGLGDFDDAVSIAGGATQSFFVVSTKKMLYQAGTEEGAPFASDESMIIYEGVGTTDDGEIFSPRVFGGIVRYDAHQTTDAICGDSVCATNEDAASCPADCARKELETTFKFGRGSSGQMFTVEALRDISVSSLVVNAMKRGQGAVQVYTRNGSYSGHDQSSAGWDLVYNDPIVTHSRRGRPTVLGDFDNAVSIAGGATQSFFVTSTNGFVYQEGTEEGAPFASDESLVIYEGIGTTGDFAGWPYSPRVFGGIIRYDMN